MSGYLAPKDMDDTYLEKYKEKKIDDFDLNDDEPSDDINIDAGLLMSLSDIDNNIDKYNALAASQSKPEVPVYIHLEYGSEEQKAYQREADKIVACANIGKLTIADEKDNPAYYAKHMYETHQDLLAMKTVEGGADEIKIKQSEMIKVGIMADHKPLFWGEGFPWEDPVTHELCNRHVTWLVNKTSGYVPVVWMRKSSCHPIAFVKLTETMIEELFSNISLDVISHETCKNRITVKNINYPEGISIPLVPKAVFEKKVATRQRGKSKTKPIPDLSTPAVGEPPKLNDSVEKPLQRASAVKLPKNAVFDDIEKNGPGKRIMRMKARQVEMNVRKNMGITDDTDIEKEFDKVREREVGYISGIEDVYGLEQDEAMIVDDDEVEYDTDYDKIKDPKKRAQLIKAHAEHEQKLKEKRKKEVARRDACGGFNLALLNEDDAKYKNSIVSKFRGLMKYGMRKMPAHPIPDSAFNPLDARDGSPTTENILFFNSKKNKDMIDQVNNLVTDHVLKQQQKIEEMKFDFNWEIVDPIKVYIYIYRIFFP